MTETNKPTAANNGENRKPVAEFRYGGVKASVWANRNDYGTSYSVKLVRSYLDKDEKWHDTEYFGRNDIFKAIEVLRDAGRFLFDGNKAMTAEENADNYEAARNGESKAA